MVEQPEEAVKLNALRTILTDAMRIANYSSGAAEYSGLMPRAVRCRPYRARWMWCRSVSGTRGSRPELYDVARTGLGACGVDRVAVLGARGPSCTMSPVPGSGHAVSIGLRYSGLAPELYDVARTGLGAKAVSIGFRFSGLAARAVGCRPYRQRRERFFAARPEGEPPPYSGRHWILG